MHARTKFARHPGLPTLLLAALAAVAPATLAAAPAADLLARYAALSERRVPELAPGDIEDLEAGRFVLRVSATPDPGTGDEISAMGLVGLQVIDAPRLLLWLSVMGGNDERDYRLTPVMLSTGNAGAYVRYQHVDLPWPVRDRHWVIRCEKNRELADASNGLAWEHYWSLHENGPALVEAAFAAGRLADLTRDDLDDAVYLPANRGAWTMFDLDEHRTLVVAWLDADLGGRFPDALVRAYTKRRLKAGFRTLADMATRVHLAYDAEPPIHDGHGRRIERGAAGPVAERWERALRLAAAE